MSAAIQFTVPASFIPTYAIDLRREAPHWLAPKLTRRRRLRGKWRARILGIAAIVANADGTKTVSLEEFKS